jgi:hypothetical protein
VVSLLIDYQLQKNRSQFSEIQILSFYRCFFPLHIELQHFLSLTYEQLVKETEKLTKTIRSSMELPWKSMKSLFLKEMDTFGTSWRYVIRSFHQLKSIFPSSWSSLLQALTYLTFVKIESNEIQGMEEKLDMKSKECLSCLQSFFKLVEQQASFYKQTLPVSDQLFVQQCTQLATSLLSSSSSSSSFSSSFFS